MIRFALVPACVDNGNGPAVNLPGRHEGLFAPRARGDGKGEIEPVLPKVRPVLRVVPFELDWAS